MKKIIKSDKLPPPVGSYSQGIEYSDFIFLSGQIAYDIENEKVINNDIELETKTIMDNIGNFLFERGLNYNNIIKVNVYLKDINDFSRFNEIYSNYFKCEFPARIVTGGNELPLNVSVELEFVIEK